MGRVAVVTGGTRGIGRAISVGLKNAGYIVAANYGGNDVAAHRFNEETGIPVFRFDVGDFGACTQGVKAIEAALGPIEVLVNNAGINRRNAFTGAPEAVLKDWQDIMAINVGGVFNVTHAFLGQLRSTKGRIVNIGSIQSFMHVRTPNSPAYTTSKHAVLGFTRALAAELGKDGVRVNAIGPGLIETPLNARVRANHPELVQIFMEHTPLGRAGKAEDIVGPAIFLASDLSAYVTGAIIMVDGGYRVI